jgi:hypothetical protein
VRHGGAIDGTDPADVTLQLGPVPVPRSCHRGRQTAAEAARATAVDRADHSGMPPRTRRPSRSRRGHRSPRWITFGPVGDLDYAMRVDAGGRRRAVAALAEEVDRDPVSARITVAGSGPRQRHGRPDGRVLDVEASTERLLGPSIAGPGEPVGSSPSPSMSPSRR